MHRRVLPAFALVLVLASAPAAAEPAADASRYFLEGGVSAGAIHDAPGESTGTTAGVLIRGGVRFERGLSFEVTVDAHVLSLDEPFLGDSTDAGDPSAHRERILAGLGAARRAGDLELRGHLGVGLQRIALSDTLVLENGPGEPTTYIHEHGSDLGPAFGGGAGAVLHAGRFWFGAEAQLSYIRHDGPALGYGNYDLSYTGSEIEALVLAGASLR